LCEIRPQSAGEVRQAGKVIATFSEEMSETDRQIKHLLMTRIYRHPEVMRVRQGAASIVTDLYRAFMADPLLMKEHYWIDQIVGMAEPVRARHVGDYLAGMTDTFAISAHRRLFDPTPDFR
ncbi:deoxyguanosinetriphosphate triphosphohydrolase, partial [Mesorhizobium sp. M1A.F.Ca.IN.020.32.1.1]